MKTPVYSGNIKSKKRGMVLLILCLVCVLFGTTGCMKNQFTRDDEEELTDRGKEIFKEYIDFNYEGAEIKTAEKCVLQDGGYYLLTDYMTGVFSYEGEYYQYAVNVETEDVYTSIAFDEFMEEWKNQIIERFSLEYDRIECTYFNFYISVPAKGQDTENLFPEDAQLRLQNVLPENVDVSTYKDEFAKNENNEVIIDLSYVGSKRIEDYHFSSEQMEWTNAPICFSLQHIKDEVELDGYARVLPQDVRYYLKEEQGTEYKYKIDGIYEYMCSEVAVISRDYYLYQQWSEYEKNGFIVCYNSYEISDNRLIYSENEYAIDEKVCEAETDFEVYVENDVLKVSELQKDALIDVYYVYVEDLSVVDNEDCAYVIENDEEDEREYEWQKKNGRYVLFDGVPYQGHTGDRIRFGV